MKRLLKWISALVFLAIVAIIVAGVAITSIVNPNQYKSIIISQFKQFTGFEIAIPGELTWSFLPHLGMEAGEVTVSDPGVFIANMKDLVLRARIAPLLHQQLDFSKVSIGTLQLNNLQATQVQARVHFQDQILQVKHVTADLYQGSLRSDATVTLKQGTPTLQVNGTLDQVDLATFLKGLSGKTSTLQFNGRGNIAWDITTQGKKTDDLLSHLNGKGNVTVDNGSVKGIDIAYFINTAAALINQQPLPAGGPSGETQFGKLTGTAVIQDGVMTCNDLTLDGAAYTVKANGTVNLVDKTLDYQLNISSKLAVKDDKVLSLYGKTVPVRVTGSLSDPSVTLDTLALMKEVGKEKLQKVGEEIQKALPDKANDVIKSLFH